MVTLRSIITWQRLGKCLLGYAASLLLSQFLCACYISHAYASPVSQNNTLIVGSEQDFPPFATGMTTNTAGGFTVDLWKAVATETGLNYTIRVQPFHQILQEFKDGKVDVLINLAQSDERRQFADFSVTHVVVHGAIFVRKNTTSIEAESDLANKSIIVLNADLAHDYAISKGWNKQLVLVDTAAEGLRLLSSGKHDAMLLSRLTGTQALQTLHINNIHALKTPAGFSQKFAFAVQKGQSDLLSRINEGLAITKANGTYNSLYEKWFGIYESQEVGLHDLLKYLLPILLLFLCIAQYSIYRRNIERKAAQKALEESEAHLRLCQISGAICTWEADVVNNKQIWSENCTRMLGFPEVREPKYEDFLALVHPEDRQKVIDASNSHIEHGTKYDVEYRAITAHGDIRWIRSAGQVERDANGTAILMRGIAQDITERKLAEAEFRIAATVFESQEGMMITDANSVILRVNHAFTYITGYTAEEVIGKTPHLLSSGRHNSEFYAAMWHSINTTGAWAGEIWNRRKSNEVYPEHLTITAVKGINDTITHYVATLTDITMSKAAAEEIQSLAFFDPLTGLPNRRLLLDRLNHAVASSARSGKQGALLFLDLDHFKMLNDTLGHDIGDLLLQQVAQRLTTCVREGDTVARLGGDEFVVMLENLNEQDVEAAAQAEAIANKILTLLNQPYLLAMHEHRSTPSIGVTLFNNHQSEVEELLKQADISMYQAKKAGRNTMRFFNPQMQANITERVSLERALSKALDSQQLQLYYQVQTNHSGHPLGAEALIRWLHPEFGIIPPIQFIPLAEETGLILPIGQWVLETACKQISTWQLSPLTRNFVLSVNVSAKQFRQADFVSLVHSAVKRCQINPMLLKLEMTESMLLDHIEDTVSTMLELKKIGIQFSLDDFGTGYSSLQYLKRLPLYQLKIDQSFVRDIATDASDQAIVRTIIAMSQSLELDVIAEGVETEEQRQLLFNKNCKRYQGYLFGRPMPIEQFEATLRPILV